MTKVSARLGLSLANHFGLVESIAPEPDIVLLPHSLLPLRSPAGLLDRPYHAIRMIRDPRDIWVSGYLYHRHCHEEWCTNRDLDVTPPIGWPRVDHALAHLPEAWKRQWLQRLNGKSYQQQLLEREMEAGLAFELAGYTGRTLAAMRQWRSYGLTVMDVKLEDVMADFDGAMQRIFEHFGFTIDQRRAALEVARSEDIRRMDAAGLARRPQIHSRIISKWRDFLTLAQIAEFERRYGDLITELGYELADSDPGAAMDSNDWFGQADLPLAADVQFGMDVNETTLIWPQSFEAAPMPHPADVRLVADGVTLRPTSSSPGSHGFVVPARAAEVRLESRRVMLTDPSAPYLGGGRSFGIKVSEITIRSRTGELVIPADDPRLTEGWHAVEQVGRAPWRWTDGSAALPWAGVTGPAVVTVHCQWPLEYPGQN